MVTDHKKIKAVKGSVLMLGANRMGNGMNFALEVPEEVSASLLLYRKRGKKPVMEIPFTKDTRTGRICAVCLRDFDERDYEYNFLIDGKICIDPCTYRIYGREHFGADLDPDPHKVRCGFLTSDSYDWEEDRSPYLPYHEMILYKLHVRGYTKANASVTGRKGTFQALVEMVPYWKKLGINAIELMPAYEFMESISQEKKDSFVSSRTREKYVNFWGYIPGYYFAPKSAYCATDQPENEFRDLVKELHKAGIECIMEMYFPSSVNSLIALRALQFWKLYYHVDGFHVVGDGTPFSLLMQDGILSNTKLMFSNLNENEISGKKNPEDKCIAEYSQGFLQDMRRFLKSDEEMVESASFRMRRNPEKYAVINYMASQDGFTMNDMVTYNYKHNEANGEENRDGTGYNFSWNCGVEGPCRKQSIRQIREQQVRNAFLMVLLSQGVPMIYAGDEIGNSQGGNNNAYCQDNPVGWTCWKGLKKNQQLLDFVTQAIAFRKEHPVLHTQVSLQGTDYHTQGLPDVSLHGERAWFLNSENTSRLLGIMYNGAYAIRQDGRPDDYIYIACNFHWEYREIALPNLPGDRKWKKVIDTSASEENGFFHENYEEYSRKLGINPRSIVVLLAEMEEKDDSSMASL
ncbi:MAG: Type II secretory pathway, pullulanase PulA and related glycosidase [Clostridia bacterium]|nr:Type II secretory pathway, pullulanase PulA and related glycosidase [Clostridia bacterium]MDY5554306.1 Type II secretory pathway, pullulanase PulA and related glycosidase [Blautia sp.]